MSPTRSSDMRVLLLILSALLSLVGSAHAQLTTTGAGGGAAVAGLTTPFWAGGASSGPANNATNYTHVSAGRSSSWTTGLTSHNMPIGLAGTITGLTGKAQTAVSGGTYIITLMDNGSGVGETNCTVSSSACVIGTPTSSAVLQNDILSFKSTVTSTPTAQSSPFLISYFFTASPGVQETPIVFGSPGTAPSTSAVNYSGPGGNQLPNATEINASGIMPIAGTIVGVAAYNATTITTGSYTITVNKNGSATSMTCSVGATSTCPTSAGSFHVSALDTISVSDTPVSTPTASALAYALLFQPDTAGLVPKFLNSSVTPPSTVASTNSYLSFEGNTGTAQTTEAAVQQLTPTPPSSITIANFVSAMSGAGPSGGMSVAVLDGATSKLSCTYGTSLTIGGVAATNSCQAAGTFSPAAGDLMSLETLPSTGTTGATLTWWKASYSAKVQ